MPDKKKEASDRSERLKVTYSLPEELVSAVALRSGEKGVAKSALVAEALGFYFAAEDRRALEVIYAQAANDPMFVEDNEEVLRDFAALDREAEDLR